MNLFQGPMISVFALLTLAAGMITGAIIGHHARPNETPKQAFARGFLAMTALCVIVFGIMIALT